MANFLQKIQSWPPEKKKKVSIWSTAVIMTVVIAVWLLFFNNFSGNGSADSTNWKNAILKLKEIITSYKGNK